MIENRDIEKILRKIASNDLALFVGAGFSHGALNAKGEPLPLGRDLNEALSMELHGKFDNSVELQYSFQTYLNRKGPKATSDFFQKLLEVRSVPQWYQIAAAIPWFRIYSINIDDLVETIFKTAPNVYAGLDTIIATEQGYEERDPNLGTLQHIKLHGDIFRSPERWTFGALQYAERAGDTQDIWYRHFVGDYLERSFVFMGTLLDEPLLFKYLEARKERTGRITGKARFSENRPESFLVSKTIGTGVAEFLRDLRITPIEASAEEFLEVLRARAGMIPTKRELLSNKYPGYAAELDRRRKTTTRDTSNIEEFILSFKRIPDNPLPPKPKMYLRGFEATWGDILENNDAPREVGGRLSKKIVARLAADENLSVFTLTGSAGSGKTTTMMRTAFQLKLEGYDVFYSKANNFPRAETISAFLDNRSVRSILFIDNAEHIQGSLPYVIAQLRGVEHPPCIVLASQTNLYWTFKDALEASANVDRTSMQDLTRRDIENLIDLLAREGLLGKLMGKSHDVQIQDFEKEARRQILVALRTATSGDGFDEIIRKEYDAIQPDAARELLLCVAIASAETMPLTKQQYLRCSTVSTNVALSYLEGELEEEVISEELRPEFLYARHETIATEIIERSAARDHLRTSYVKVLAALADDIDFSSYAKRKRTVAYKLFTSIINHDTVYRRFQSRIELAREIYESVHPSFEQDWHFWLQFGLLELSYGELQLARNYLDQAAGLNSASDWVIHSRAKLLLAEAVNASTLDEALVLREEAVTTLETQIRKPLILKKYPYDILISGQLKWMRQWCTSRDECLERLEYLRKVAKDASMHCPEDDRLHDLQEQIEYEYLSYGR